MHNSDMCTHPFLGVHVSNKILTKKIPCYEICSYVDIDSIPLHLLITQRIVVINFLTPLCFYSFLSQRDTGINLHNLITKVLVHNMVNF